ncbi:EcsC family protein [Phytohabitans sp. ZYX-F-186]|uniref:EcsC family protein n=1 Tax=Phytohabitans maris TaxID=3071409 RepID=A0ABU0Z8V0_9ACTN|nr:EcsC family protein [Phytohabitans sp. ZYX-F-186]MDQ7903480.1 EcsC family protein [Phytohabitans sp. ZYX-F-186]
MAEPSEYELAAWRDIQRFKGRPLSAALRSAGEGVSNGVAALGRRAATYLENHPGAQSVVSRGRGIAAKGASAIGTGARKAAGVLPVSAANWSGSALGSMQRTVARISRAGLSPKRVVQLHQKRGHDVTTLSDLRRLDLEQIHAVRGRALSWYYPATAAVSGMGAGLVISGGELVTAVSGGAAAAPSGGAIVSAFAGDAAIVIGLASRAVGHVSLLYGYDPEEPAEKLFVLSVVNAGTAASVGAKNAAFADISRLTQALVRGKTWKVLNDSVVARIAGRFAEAVGHTLTKKGLGKVVPVAGILVGGTLNWTTLEGIVDTAEMAYRRRFLLEKYPQLLDEEPIEAVVVEDTDDPNGVVDGGFSVLGELAAEGEPDLH